MADLDVFVDFADDCFSNASKELLDIPDESEVIECDGWEDDGDDRLTRKFYYDDPMKCEGESKIGTFVVVFDDNSTMIADCYSNTY